MKPDWDKLGGYYADHPSVLIVDVDCTADGQGTCQRMGVQGYPTIKYFMSGDKKGKDYVKYTIVIWCHGRQKGPYYGRCQ